ncbi:MAG TPA: substrate-binding domain-containing protein [Spirochaetota bacterium]|nr:substrate-binding domain-containing protein [Spirochaetota bacterium]HPJ40107.1 substrate-binding domain-containing protein [Spirochaetota bacterium]HPQ52728.1 substrate-binding domain-containing protein [Spirochaetota bacterium]
MSEELMSTKEVAAYLNIHEKQVYALIKANQIPCTRVTGKWVFPKHIIDEWLTSNINRDTISSQRNKRGDADTIFAAGSNDPILDILMNGIKKENVYIFSCSTGSMEGLHLLKQGMVDVSWCHLLDPESGEYNIPYLKENYQSMKIALVHLFYREIGFLSSRSLSSPVKDFSDLGNNSIRFINRQKGSGTRILLDHHLKKAGIDPGGISGYEKEVYTHFEVGLNILSGSADAGIATIAVSKLFGLPFVPIIRESFDMVLTQNTFFKKSIQSFIQQLNSDEFRNEVKPLGDYDFTESGKIIYSSE